MSGTTYAKLVRLGNHLEPAEVVDATDDVNALRAFAQDVMSDWPLSAPDGFDIQNYAIKHGLLLPQQRFEPCRPEHCQCAEYFAEDEFKGGITCYRKTPRLIGD